MCKKPKTISIIHTTLLSISCEFVLNLVGTCTVLSVNGTLVEAKLCTFTLESTHFIFNFTLTTVQVPNLAPTHKKRITVQYALSLRNSDSHTCDSLS
jgi:hypothetical protein